MNLRPVSMTCNVYNNLACFSCCRSERPVILVRNSGVALTGSANNRYSFKVLFTLYTCITLHSSYLDFLLLILRLCNNALLASDVV